LNSPRVRACDIGRYIIQWGEGQEDPDVAQTLAQVHHAVALARTREATVSMSTWPPPPISRPACALRPRPQQTSTAASLAQDNDETSADIRALLGAMVFLIETIIAFFTLLEATFKTYVAESSGKGGPGAGAAHLIFLSSWRQRATTLLRYLFI
jgi:hypothetical protein